MFRAMYSGHGGYSHSVASSLAQIGVDPGYYSDSECSSGSTDKTGAGPNQTPSPPKQQQPIEQVRTEI